MSITKEKVGTALLGVAAALFVYISARQAVREVTPRAFDANEPVLHLVNFDAADAEQLRHVVLPSWMGVLRSCRVANEVILMSDDACSSVMDTLRSEARQAFLHLSDTPAAVPVSSSSSGATAAASGAANNKKKDGEDDDGASPGAAAADDDASAAPPPRPATLAMRHIVEIAGSSDLDLLLSPIELARKCQGLPMEVTTLLALATGPSNSEVDVVRFSVKGRVCAPLFLEKLAAARARADLYRQQHDRQMSRNCKTSSRAAAAAAAASAVPAALSSDDQLTSSILNATDNDAASAAAAFAATASTAFAAANFVSIYDVFEPASKTGLLDDFQLQWQRFFGNLPGDEVETGKKDQAAASAPAFPNFSAGGASSSTESQQKRLAADGCTEHTEPFIRRWRRAKLLAASPSSTSSSPLSRLLLEPWKYRAFLYVAHSIMYGQLDRRFGSVFSGISRGVAHAANVARRTFSLSSTGTVVSSAKKATSFIGGVFSGSSSASTAGTEEGKKRADENAFSRISDTDFGASCGGGGSDEGGNGNNSEANPLGGEFLVSVTVRTKTERELALLRNFAAAVGVQLRVAETAAVPASPASGMFDTESMELAMTAGGDGPLDDYFDNDGGENNNNNNNNNNGMGTRHRDINPREATIRFVISGALDCCASAAFDFALQVAQVGVLVTAVKLQLPLSDIRTAYMMFKQRKLANSNNGNGSKSDSDLPLASALKAFYVLDAPMLGIVPVRDFEARDPAFMSQRQHFETQLCVRIPASAGADAVLAKVRDACSDHGAMIVPAGDDEDDQQPAPTAVCSLEDGCGGQQVQRRFWIYMAVLREYSTGAITALEKADALKKELEAIVPAATQPAEESTTTAKQRRDSRKDAPVQVSRWYTVFDSAGTGSDFAL